MKSVIFTCRIQLGEDETINGEHLCEEIQCYLNSNSASYDETIDQYVDTKVVGYKLQFDNFIPFIAQEEY